MRAWYRAASFRGEQFLALRTYFVSDCLMSARKNVQGKARRRRQYECTARRRNAAMDVFAGAISA
jgi:hypothetical protein